MNASALSSVIRTKLSNDQTPDVITDTLLAEGWDIQTINMAFAQVRASMSEHTNYDSGHSSYLHRSTAVPGTESITQTSTRTAHIVDKTVQKTRSSPVKPSYQTDNRTSDVKSDLPRFVKYILGIIDGTSHVPTLLIISAISIITLVRPMIDLYTKVFPFIDTMESSIEEIIDKTIPADLTVTIQDGIASINKPEPYFISINKSFLESVFSISPPEESGSSRIRLITIDTKGSAENFDAYQSYSLLTDRNFIYYNDGNVQIASLRDMGNHKINKVFILGKYRDIINKYHVKTIITTGRIVAPFLFFFILIFAQIVSYSGFSLLLILVSRGIGIIVPYRHVFRLVAVMSLIPAIFWQTIGFAYRQSSSVAFMGIFFLCYITLYLYKQTAETESL